MSTRSILLADDSATIRKVVELALSESGFHIESVASGADALARLRQLHPDLVLADVAMPEPSGYELCRRIKASDRPVPVLLLADTFETFDHDRARDCGADGCLMKPFESRTLMERVESLLAERRSVDAALEPLEAPPEKTGTAVEAEPLAPGAERADRPSALHPLSAEAIDAIAEAVVRKLTTDVVRQIAKEVAPHVAEVLLRSRLGEPEDGDSREHQG